MLMEALEILQSSEGQDDTFVTDFTVYKLYYLLIVYLPLFLSTFLKSQEYLGDKIACFPPENFTDPQAASVNEYCWTHGYWISSGASREKSPYTQPHRYYPLHLSVQAILMAAPLVLWNMKTKTQLLSALRGTAKALDSVLQIITNDDESQERRACKARLQLRQCHAMCLAAARSAQFATVCVVRVALDFGLLVLATWLQFASYDHRPKEDYRCTISELRDDVDILCTVPILDLLDLIWSLSVASLILALLLNFTMMLKLHSIHYEEYQPTIYASLPYGDADEAYAKVTWEDPWTKDSYRLMSRIFMENNAIMTKAYVLQALKPTHKLRLSSRTASLEIDRGPTHRVENACKKSESHNASGDTTGTSSITNIQEAGEVPDKRKKNDVHSRTDKRAEISHSAVPTALKPKAGTGRRKRFDGRSVRRRLNVKPFPPTFQDYTFLLSLCCAAYCLMLYIFTAE